MTENYNPLRVEPPLNQLILVFGLSKPRFLPHSIAVEIIIG